VIGNSRAQLLTSASGDGGTANRYHVASGAGSPYLVSDVVTPGVNGATATNQAATATTQNATATNQNTTATNQNTGGGGAHNNQQKFITCYMWKRTA